MKKLLRAIKRTVVTTGLIFGIILEVQATDYYADANRSDDSGDGQSRETAKKTIQAAVDLASPEDTVLVATGFYFPPSEITITNAITVKSTGGEELTQVNGSGTHRCFNINGTAILDGFMITGGFTTNASEAHGGGIYCINGTIQNCTVRDNISAGGDSLGGGIYCENGTIQNCTISDNTAVGDEHDGYGGHGVGGGVYCADCTILNCIISGNAATGGKNADGGYGGGGGIYCFESTIRNCTITDNSTIGGNTNTTGGMVQTFGGGGGGIYSIFDCSIQNCTISDNTTKDGEGGGIYCLNSSIKNSITWRNLKDGTENNYDLSTFATMETCCTTNPLFVDAQYRLSATSPCIDAGVNLPGVTNDIDGFPRPWDGDGDGTAIADIGAHEYYSTSIDNDSDDLSDWDEVWVYRTNPSVEDSDNDGTDDGDEVSMGLDPAVNNTSMLTAIVDNPDLFGLYTSNAVLDIAVGQMALQTAENNATLQLQLECSDDLQSWTNAGEAIEWQMPVGDEKKFFRVRSGK